MALQAPEQAGEVRPAVAPWKPAGQGRGAAHSPPASAGQKEPAGAEQGRAAVAVREGEEEPEGVGLALLEGSVAVEVCVGVGAAEG